MRRGACAAVIVALLAAGCSSPSVEPRLSSDEALTSAACHHVNAVMASTSGVGPRTITWNENQPSHSPVAEMVEAVNRSPNAGLRAELTAFEAAAKAGSVLGTTNAAESMVRTCRGLGFG
jgi:hypothetical protein